MPLARFWGPFFATNAMNVSYVLVFSSLERLWPARPGQPRLRRGFWVDVAYVASFFGIAWLLDSVPFPALVARIGDTLGGPGLRSVQAWVAGLPGGVSAVLAVIVADLAGYWKHRLHHTRVLWPFHAVHHSPDELDFLSNERIHPVEGVLTAVFHVVPLLLLGFPPTAIAVAATVRRAHSLYQHANLRFSYGRWEHVFVSPSLHRWHHARDPGMFHRNYANVFAAFDWLFGTLRLPPHPEPDVVGLPWMPTTFPAQLLWPFRRAAWRAADAVRDSS